MNINNNNQVNNAISCNVCECKYHSGSQNYCTLNHIDVVKNTQNAQSVACTDCASFQLR